MTHHQAFDAPATAVGLQDLGADLTRFLMEHELGVDEVTTKIAILQEEFAHLHDYNPIDHLESGVKSPRTTSRGRRGCRDGRQSRRADGTAAQANPSGRTSCRSGRQGVAQLTLRSKGNEFSPGATQGQ